MKAIYVAGKWQERERIRGIHRALRGLGHKITVDWTGHEEDDTEFPSGYAVEDVRGVQNADLFIGLFANKHEYKGALVEMGVALGLNIPVYIIGHAIDSCVFSAHPLVHTFDSLDELLNELKGG